MSKFRLTIRWRVKVITTVLSLYFIFICVRERNHLENQTLFFVQYGSGNLCCIVMALLSSLKLSLVDYSVLWMTCVRCLVTWMVFKYKFEGKPGFSEVDIKQLQDSIFFIYLPSFLLASTNWSLDFFLTFPIALIATLLTTTNAYSLENGNMNCFA